MVSKDAIVSDTVLRDVDEHGATDNNICEEHASKPDLNGAHLPNHSCFAPDSENIYERARTARVAELPDILDLLLRIEEKLRSFGLHVKDNKSVFSFGARIEVVDCLDADAIANIVHDLIADGELSTRSPSSIDEAVQ